MLLRIYQDLKFLGHPKYQVLDKSFQSSLLDKDTLEEEVIVFSSQWMYRFIMLYINILSSMASSSLY